MNQNQQNTLYIVLGILACLCLLLSSGLGGYFAYRSTTAPATTGTAYNVVTSPKTMQVQMCNPWAMESCPYSGTEMTCQEYWDCLKSKGDKIGDGVTRACAGEAFFTKCGSSNLI